MFETVQKLQGSQADGVVKRGGSPFETVQKLQGSQASLRQRARQFWFETVQKLQGSQAMRWQKSLAVCLRLYRNYKVLKLEWCFGSFF